MEKPSPVGNVVCLRPENPARAHPYAPLQKKPRQKSKSWSANKYFPSFAEGFFIYFLLPLTPKRFLFNRQIINSRNRQIINSRKTLEKNWIVWYHKKAKHPIEYSSITRSMYFYLLVKIQAPGFHALGYGNWMFGDSWSCVFFGATVSAAALFCFARREDAFHFSAL